MLKYPKVQIAMMAIWEFRREKQHQISKMPNIHIAKMVKRIFVTSGHRMKTTFLFFLKRCMSICRHFLTRW